LNLRHAAAVSVSTMSVGNFLDRGAPRVQTRTVRNAVLVGLAALAAYASARRARADVTTRPGSLVPVVSDDEADWQKERPPAYLGFGASAAKDLHYHADLYVEGGMRVATTPIWVHGLIGSGGETQIQDQGQFLEARGGIELSCQHRTVVCGFFGIDVGGQLESTIDKDGNEKAKLDGVVAVPRMGLDLGGNALRIRASVDGRWFRYETMVLPLSDDGKSVNMLISAISFHDLKIPLRQAQSSAEPGASLNPAGNSAG